MPAPDYTAWATTTDVDDLLCEMGITLRDCVTDDMKQTRIDAVVQDVTTRTHRQFLADEEESERFFDGSGTGLQTIDEFVEYSQVRVVGFFGAQATGLNLLNTYAPSPNTYPQTLLQIYQGSYPSLTRIWMSEFPRGRSNIGVTAKWGYGATIPVDLWLAVAQMASVSFADTRSVSQGGRLLDYSEAWVTEKVDPRIASEITGWKAGYEMVIRKYKRPLSERFARAGSKLV